MISIPIFRKTELEQLLSCPKRTWFNNCLYVYLLILCNEVIHFWEILLTTKKVWTKVCMIIILFIHPLRKVPEKWKISKNFILRKHRFEGKSTQKAEFEFEILLKRHLVAPDGEKSRNFILALKHCFINRSKALDEWNSITFIMEIITTKFIQQNLLIVDNKIQVFHWPAHGL